MDSQSNEEFRKAQMATYADFVSALESFAETCDCSIDDAMLIAYQLAGMTPWKAYALVHNEEPANQLELERARSVAEDAMKVPMYNPIKEWIRSVGVELYHLDLKAYDWKFKDSENELHYLIEKSKMSMRHDIKPQTANIMLGAIKELNKMYEYSGKHFNPDALKTVIFTGNDELLD